jgi:hypothetical protein
VISNRAEILARPPVSGHFPEVAFGAANDLAWVLFRPRTGQDWVGRFDRADIGPNAVAFTEVGDVAVVVAGGVGYAVNIETRAIAFDMRLSQLQGVVAVPSSNVIIVHDWDSLYAFSPEGEVWRSPRMAVDGIQITHAGDGFVTGVAHGIGEDAEFRLDIRTWRYSASRELLYL